MLIWLCLQDKSLKVLLSEWHPDLQIKATVTMAMQSQVNKILDLTGRPEDRTRTQRGNRTIRLSQQGPMTPDIPREDISTSTWVDVGRCELPMQGKWVRSLIWEDATCLRAAKPVHPWACALNQERPPQWEERVLQLETSPVCCNHKKPVCSKEDPVQPNK